MNIYECFVCGDPQESKTCDRCRARIRGDLLALPEQYVYLTLSRQRLQGGGGDGRSGKALHAPLPGAGAVLNLLGPAARDAVTDARDQEGSVPFLAVLEGWCEAVVEERGLTGVRKDVSSMVTLLTRHLPWVCEQTWVADFQQEIRDLVRTSQQITMTQPRREHLSGIRCPRCEEMSLWRYFPSDWRAECLNCPVVKLDQRDYDDLVSGQAQRAHDAVKG
ncbi:hypothetical protein [Streptomyces sp. NPDC046979]|uniref:hypothetical protein n=1 Tax=Streptomyces sp. NPDC046979 TaxID=3154604 RepID=UPI0033EB0044